MAVDTRNKRASVIALALPFTILGGNPDGTIDQADRQQTAWVYSGILARAFESVTVDSISVVPSASATLNVLPAASGAFDIASSVSGEVTIQPEDT